MNTSKNLRPQMGAGSALRRLCLGGVCLLGSAVLAPGQTTPPVASQPPPDDRLTYSGWIDFSAGGIWLDGNKAAFQQQRQLPNGTFGGVESFFWETDVNDDTTFRMEARSIFDSVDYRVKMELANPDLGYLRGGYHQFRTWYDGSGGFFPPSDTWFSFFDQNLFIDRGEAFIEGGLTLPNWPVLTLRYAHQFRRGQKDSTVWGDSDVGFNDAGAFVGQGGAGSTSRRIVPAFRDIDESRNIFEARLAHTLGNTDLGLGVRYEVARQDNELNVRQRPGEPADRQITQRELVETDVFSTHAYSKTRLHEKVLFTTGYIFSTLDTDLGGSRLSTGADVGFNRLSGGSQSRQHVANLNLMYTPWDHFMIIPSVRIEKEEIEGQVGFLDIPPLGAGEREALNDREEFKLSERLELRYTGLPKWVFYARGDWQQGQGELSEQRFNLDTATVQLNRFTDFDRDSQKYTVGANWYPARWVSLAGQYYHKIRENRWDHPTDDTGNTTGNRYPAFLRAQNLTTDDLNFRVTLRPLNGVTLVSRYDFQLSTIDTKGDQLSSIESGRMTSHIFSQSATWVPLPRLYLQASANYAMDRTETPANDLTGAGAGRVSESRNDYLYTSASIGYALNPKTDLELTYFYYLTDNYVDNSLRSVAYDTSENEHGLTAGLLRRVKDNIIWGLKYGFFAFRDDASGGNRNYDAHLLYSTLSIRF
jgi:hypothetical protein